MFPVHSKVNHPSEKFRGVKTQSSRAVMQLVFLTYHADNSFTWIPLGENQNQTGLRPLRTGLWHLWSTRIDFAHRSSMITSTEWASLFSLKFLARRWIRAEWSIPVPAVPVPPARPKLVLVPVLVLVFLSFSWRISHRELWLALTGSSTGGLRRPLAALYLRPGMSWMVVKTERKKKRHVLKYGGG